MHQASGPPLQMLFLQEEKKKHTKQTKLREVQKKDQAQTQESKSFIGMWRKDQKEKEETMSRPAAIYGHYAASSPNV